MELASIVTAERSRFFNPSQPWVYAPKSYAQWNGGVTSTENNVTGPAIDCSNFVQQAMLLGGYNVPEITASNLASIFKGGVNSSYWSTPNIASRV
jgi:hypothetical protein